jgi:hypothetical protein
MVIYYDDKPIQNTISGTPFDAPDDWLSHLSVKIRNVSSKPLIAGNLQLSFNGLRGDIPVIYLVWFGSLPDHMLYTASEVKRPQPTGEIPISPVAPGDTITIPFKNVVPLMSKKLLATGPLSDVKECSISYGTYFFTEGLRWSMGNYDREDPSTLGHYVPSPREALMPTP